MEVCLLCFFNLSKIGWHLNNGKVLFSPKKKHPTSVNLPPPPFFSRHIVRITTQQKELIPFLHFYYKASNSIKQSQYDSYIYLQSSQQRMSSSNIPQSLRISNQRNAFDQGKRNRYRHGAEIKYHLPYERLARRRIFQEIFRRYVKDDQLLKLDNFALFDAVAKRGGYQQVCARNRWEEIGICLQYEKKLWAFPKYYQDNLLPLQSELTLLCTWYSKTPPFESQTYEMHLLTPNNLTTSYYHMTSNQYLLAQANFFSLDEYFNIKTIALTTPDFSKVSVEYAEKYIILRKWLFFSGQAKQNSIKELKLLGIKEANEAFRVVIVGLSMTTLLIADKLSDFGLQVVIFDKGKREAKLKDEFQVVENGVMLLQGGNGKGSYLKHLESNYVSLVEINTPNNGILVLDQQGKPYPQQKIRASEQHFFAIMDQLKSEVMSKKNLYEEVITRMIRRKLDYQRFLIRWHYDRYMTFNRIKGDSTTVSDLATYQGKKFIKHIAQSYNLCTIQSIDKLFTRVKEKKNVTILQTPIDHITHQDAWNVHYRSQNLRASHLIYADQEAIFKGAIEGVPKLPEIGSEIMGDALVILQQLTVMKYINCLFRFRQKILLKDALKNQSCFSVCCPHGFIYFFVLNNGTEILAILKCYHANNLNYYSQILNTLQSKCLFKNNRLVNEQLYSFQYTFGVKDEKFMESIIRIKQTEKMFLLLPITTTNCPHRMTAQIDMANYICGNVLDEVHPNYQKYDPVLRGRFLQKEEVVPMSPAFVKSASKELEPIDREKWKKEKEGSMISIPSIGSIASIPQISSAKSITVVQEPPKIKIVPVVGNVPSEVAVKCVEGEVPSVNALSQVQEDWFGVNHPFVKGYELFIKSRVEGSARPKEGLTNLSIFALKEPVQLYPNTYLLTLGTPIIKEHEWFTCILPNPNNNPPPSNYIFSLHGMTTRRQYISIFDTLRTTIYFQIIMMIGDEVFYCMADEMHPKVVYYHKNMAALMEIFNRKLEQLRGEEIGAPKSYSNHKIIRCRMNETPPNQLLPCRIAQLIQAEIKHLNDLSLDDLILKKLQGSLQSVKYQKFMTGDHQILLQDTKLPPNYSFFSTSQQIYKEISDYVEAVTKIHDLKPFSLFDIFFGVLDEQYIACQIMRKFSKDALSYFDLDKLDEPLSKEIQEIFSKNINNELFALMIVPEDKSVLFHRNFIHSQRLPCFERYNYKRLLELKGTECSIRHLRLDSFLNSTQFPNTEAIMLDIIQRLSQHYSQQLIVQEFHTLIDLQIGNEANLTPRIKMYYRMTKKHFLDNANPSSVGRFNDKCKDLNPKQKQDLYQLMKRRKMRWVDNEIIVIVK